MHHNITPTAGGSTLAPNLAAASEYLARLDPEAPSFTFQTIPEAVREDGTKDRQLARVICGDPANGILRRLARANELGAGIFVTVNETDGEGRQEHNVVGVRVVFLDLDGAPLAPILACGLEPHFVCETSPGHFHVYWRVDDCPLDQCSRVQQALARRFAGDPSVHDLPRVLRMPGFLHLKATPFLSHILEGVGYTGPPYSLAEIVGTLGLKLDEPAAPHPADADGRITPGNRHSHLFALSRSMKVKNAAPGAILAALHAENATRCDPPLPDADVEYLVKRAFTARDAAGWENRPTANVSNPPDAPEPSVSVRELPEPQNLFDVQAPPVLDLRGALPAVLANFAATRAGIAGHDPTAYAYAAIAAASSVIPHATRLEIAATWREPLLQWVGIVAPTGGAKTPTMNGAVEPVIALHQDAHHDFAAELAAQSAAKGKGAEPKPMGYYFTDPSIEALIDRAANARHTILRHADEGTSWLNAMGRYAQSDNGERYLACSMERQCLHRDPDQAR